MTKHAIQTGLVGALLASGSLFAAASGASASTLPHTFAGNQTTLEQQLASRAVQLTRLSADIKASTTLSAAHAAALNVNVSAATANINALIAKVPNDTTQAQLRVDRRAMLAQNRVFAVLTPQVFQTIEADSITAQVAVQEGQEPSLQASVTSIIGQTGWKNARNHYEAFVKSVNTAAVDAANVATRVLAQAPADYPHDTSVFVRANHGLLNADIALAHASYDVSVIGLATGGYTGA